MTTEHPITPPPELVRQWIDATKSPGCVDVHLSDWEQRLASQAARWGADQELEACCEWLEYHYPSVNCGALRVTRRPKPSSLKEQALKSLEGLVLPDDAFTTISRALNLLDD